MSLQQISPQLLQAVQELDAARKGLTEVTLREVGVNPPGAVRLGEAVSRLLKIFTIEGGDLAHARAQEVALSFDAGVVSSLAANVTLLVANPEWDPFRAFDLAYTTDRYTADRLAEYFGRDAANPPEFQKFERIQVQAKNAAEDARLEMQLRKSAASVEEIAESVKQAAGVVAEGKLSEAFKEYSETEMSGATRYRGLALGVLGAVVAFSIYTAAFLPTSLGSSLAHLGIGLSSLTAFGYLARESAHHRKAARWASVMSVQLRTFDAYSADLTTEKRELLREHFGRRVFAEPVYALDGHEPKTSDLAPLMQAAIDLVKVARAN
ncbi:hypothetical protein EV651_103604 [Kribbella sp. VKM Ac-2571]|uniref:hypothetical protein n=1 Tax=Kribbella sp. VKM Ac-2571 TaxID=2512222 RepID=UPI00105B917D|nr:hypothetical protein [Kribbella sp. VKM Ac-2571]TDO67690.1 hypothetical protein EV651_103604 [Kribbella sp. VKM Ac-2571]